MTTNSSLAGRKLRFLVVAASVSSLGGFLFGYDNIVISGAIGYLRITLLDPQNPSELFASFAEISITRE